MKIMQKVSQWFSNISNSTKIRQFFTVKRQLSIINILLIIIAISLGIWAIGYKCFGVGVDAIPGAFACALFFTWLFGLRFAIANSKEAKERYVQKTVRALGRLGKLIFWLAVVCACVAYVGVVLATMVRMGSLDKLVEVYPTLTPLSISITAQVDRMLAMLLAFLF